DDDLTEATDVTRVLRTLIEGIRHSPRIHEARGANPRIAAWLAEWQERDEAIEAEVQEIARRATRRAEGGPGPIADQANQVRDRSAAGTRPRRSIRRHPLRLSPAGSGL